MKYVDFEMEDFATDDFFISWVLSPNRELDNYWQDLILRNPTLAPRIESARVLVLNLHEACKNPGDSVRVAKIWEKVQGEIPAPNSARRFKVFPLFRIAAALLIVAISTFGIRYVFTKMSGEIASPIVGHEDNLIEELNTSGSILRIHLSDGTVVSLENNSRLKYPRYFTRATNREVYLTGEGFFDVAKNSQQPFLVHTKSITTKVLGTSFRITAYEDEKNIVVAVKEGKVSVFSSTNAVKKSNERESEVNGVVLNPNQKVTYNLAENSFDKTLVDNPEKIDRSPLSTSISFENSPVREVFSALESLYGVEIIFDEEAMQNCYLTVPLGEEPLFEKLNIICRTIGASYELIDGTLVINGKGC